MKVNVTCIVFTNFLYIFDCYNISICKKEKLKDETSEKICETNRGQIKEQDVPLTSIAFTNSFRCLIFDLFFFTNADFVTIKDEASKENSWDQCRSN